MNLGLFFILGLDGYHQATVSCHQKMNAPQNCHMPSLWVSNNLFVLLIKLTPIWVLCARIIWGIIFSAFNSRFLLEYLSTELLLVMHLKNYLYFFVDTARKRWSCAIWLLLHWRHLHCFPRICKYFFYSTLCDFEIEECLIICVSIINNCNRYIYALLTCGVKMAG